MTLAAERHMYLTVNGAIDSDPQPDRGYSVFARIKRALPDKYPVLDGRFFDQKNRPGFIKINLLSPSINLLIAAVP
jgi:hypothetical protein